MMRAEILRPQLADFAPGELVDLAGTPWRWIHLSPIDPAIRCLVDADDHAWLSANVWNIWHAGRTRGLEWQLYAKRNVGVTRATVRMHREIMIAAEPWQTEAFIGSHVVDHVNGQTLDNRRANLRWSTTRDNVMNRRARGTAPSLDSIVLELLASLGPPLKLSEVPF